MTEFTLEQVISYAKSIKAVEARKIPIIAFYEKNMGKYVLKNPDAEVYYLEGTKEGQGIEKATVYEGLNRIPQRKPLSWKRNPFIVVQLTEKELDLNLKGIDVAVQVMTDGFIETLAKD